MTVQYRLIHLSNYILQITVPCKLLAQRSLVTEAGCPQRSKLLCHNNAPGHGQGSYLLFQVIGLEYGEFALKKNVIVSMVNLSSLLVFCCFMDYKCRI